jgi:O-Antigen ligase
VLGYRGGGFQRRPLKPISMELFSNQSWAADVGPSGTMRALSWLLGSLSFLAIAILLPMSATPVGIAILGGWILLIWVAISFIRGHFDYVVLVWVAVFPYCYYFFSYPAERAIFTIDRAFIVLLAIELFLLSRRSGAAPLTREVRISGYLWGLYLLVCFRSLADHPVFEVLSSYRLLLDGMLMPALLGLYAVRLFPITRNLTKLHGCVCVLMLGIAVVCGSELVSGKNLLPWPGAAETWVYTQDAKILRVDGPFENSSVLSVIGVVGFFFIIYSRRLIGSSLTSTQHLLHSVGLLASLASALMPMNRGLIIAVLACASIDYFAKAPLISRTAWNCLFAALLFAAVVAKLLYPGVFEDRVTRGDNFYQRIAQDVQTSEVIRDHPLMGVGFSLYPAAVIGDPRYAVQWGGFEAMNVPHNSLLSVLAEEGIVGFLLYAGGQFYFIRAMWRMRKVNRLGWQVFLYCVLVYIILGFDVGIAYYSDLNLFYMFMLGIILQIQLRMLPESNPNAFSSL